MFDLENFPTRELAKDMMSMISPIYDNSYVGKWIFEVMSVPLSLAQDTINELREQVFPETATWSLPYWEQSYGLPTNEALSIEERRSRVFSKRVSAFSITLSARNWRSTTPCRRRRAL